MKSFYYIIFCALLSLNVVFAQRVAMHTINNFNINTSTNKFSFDIYSHSTGVTPPNTIRVGLTSYLIFFNSAALNSPTISNVNSKYTTGSPTGDYNAMTVQTSLGNKINVTINFSGLGDGIGDLLSNANPDGELICTVTLNITNQSLTAGVSWDITNSAMTSPVIQNSPTNNYQGSFDGLLPVELTSFTGKADGNKSIDLNWVTKTEVSNYGFYVERSINEGDWNSLTFIEGHGNSNSPKQYSYSDKDLFTGGSKFQYRLKQVDTDGQFEYSDVVEVEILPTKFELSQNYPNPFNPSTTIQFSLPKATQLKINVYNMIGELVRTLADGNYDAGYHKVTLNAVDLPSGAYIYRIESAAFVQVKKMILIK
jgi:hypothetical protein